MTHVRRTTDEQAADLFHRKLRPLLDGPNAEDLFPSWLAQAVASALDADGAGLSLIDDSHRIPIGASSAHAASAERLQFTLGEGPCLDAVAQHRGVRVDEDQMRVQWPPFHAELVDNTPFRSVVAVPMALQSGLRGAMDVYFTEPSMPAYSVVTAAESVVLEVARLLDHLDDPDGGPDGSPAGGAGELPAWVYGPQARQRLRVWLAVGLVIAEYDEDPEDALARVRAYAFVHDVNLDSLTTDLISGAVPVAELAQG